jgi:hypothetical protein
VSPARTTVLTEPPRSGYSLISPFSTRLDLPPEHVEAAGVVMLLLLTAALLWQRR